MSNSPSSSSIPVVNPSGQLSMQAPSSKTSQFFPQSTTLKDILQLERLENDYFRGVSPENPRWGRVYGGQLVAQSIAACVNTLDPNTHRLHSLHCYFLRPGDDEVPLFYQVTRLKDTRTFVSRRVDCIQYGQIIFTALLQLCSPDINMHTHTIVYDMSTVPSPDSLPDLSQDFFELSMNSNLPVRNRQLLYYSGKRQIPFDIKWVTREDTHWVNWSESPQKRHAQRLLWMKTKAQIQLDTENAEETQKKKSYFPNPESTGSLLGQSTRSSSSPSNTTNQPSTKQSSAAPASKNPIVDRQQVPSLYSLLQCVALAYMSDWGMIAVAMKPHPFPSLSPDLQLASLDHSIHFFSTDFRADDWLLFDIQAPQFAHSKALLCGNFYNQRGELVARVQQEALIRVKRVDLVTRYPTTFIPTKQETQDEAKPIKNEPHFRMVEQPPSTPISQRPLGLLVRDAASSTSITLQKHNTDKETEPAQPISETSSSTESKVDAKDTESKVDAKDTQSMEKSIGPVDTLTRRAISQGAACSARL